MNGSFLTGVEWFRPLSLWAFLAGTAYVTLIILIVGFIMPVGKPSPLPEKYFELIAAGRKPRLYRLTVMFDVITWAALSGFLVTCAAIMVQQAPLQSLFTAVLATGLLSGFIGAGLRLAVNPDLAKQYLAASSTELQSPIVQSYARLLRIIDALFSIGGLLAGIALVLIASIAWSMTEFSHWPTILLGLSGVVAIAKSTLEMATGDDFGLLQLSGNILLIVSFFAIAIRFW